MKHHFCEEGCSTTARMIIKKIPAVWKTNGGVVDPGAVQQETIVFFACNKPTSRTAPELKRQWSEQSEVQWTTGDCSWATFETWFQVVYCKKKPTDNGKIKKSETSVGWRTPSLDTSTPGEDSMVRWVQLPAISNPSKCQSPKETWGRICTCLHCCNCETWRKHNGLGMYQCWTANRLWGDDEFAQV